MTPLALTTSVAPPPREASPRDTWSGLDEFRPVLFRFLVRRCRDENETDDLIQETLVRAARYRSDLVNRARLRSWIVQIAVNVFRDHVRRSARGPLVACEEEVLQQIEASDPAPGDTCPDEFIELGGEVIDKDVVLGDLQAAYRSLRATDRVVLDSYYARDRSTATIAKECGISQSLVKVRLFRARRKLEREVRLRTSRRRARRMVAPLA